MTKKEKKFKDAAKTPGGAYFKTFRISKKMEQRLMDESGFPDENGEVFEVFVYGMRGLRIR